MKLTYYIEDSSGEIIRYTSTLTEAKQTVIAMLGAYSESDLRIVALRGHVFGEGFHQYYMKYKNNRFIKIKR